MDSVLKERLLVAGEMVEKFFPSGFCAEVVDLASRVTSKDAKAVLSTYDYFLQTQQRYQAVTHQVYEELSKVLSGAESGQAWRLQFLVDNARLPYEEAYMRLLRKAVQACRLHPTHLHTEADLKAIMDAVGTLSFLMADSPAYPSERALKYYHFLYSGKKLKSLDPLRLLSLVLPHSVRLLEEHEALLGA